MKIFFIVTINRTASHTIRDNDLDGSHLPQLTSFSDLGIEITSNLSFQSYICNIVSQARQRIGRALFRGFQTRNIPLKKKASLLTYVHCWNIIPIFGSDASESY